MKAPGRYPSEIVAGQYRLDDKLGRGAFAEVWAAEHVSTGRRCALKILHDQHIGDRSARERLEREGEILADLDHPNIARAVAFDVVEGTAFIVMELVDGIALRKELLARARTDTFLGADALLSVLKPIAAALDYAHGRGVLHRDLKPGNVMLSRNGDVKLLDFGIAKMLGAPADLETTAGRILGSKHYLSPEQIKCERVDVAADVFALATSTFVMLTHHQPWARDAHDRPVHYASMKRASVGRIPDILGRITAGARPRPSDCRSGIGADLDELMMRALAIAPDVRPASASSFVAGLEEALAGSEAFTRIIDTSEDVETVLATQFVDDDMVVDESDEPLELIDVSRVHRAAQAPPLPPVSPPPRWIGAALAAAGLLVVVSLVVAFSGPRDEAPPAAPTPTAPAVAARPAPQPRSDPTPPAPPPPPPRRRVKQPPPPPAAPPRPRVSALDRALTRLEDAGDLAAIEAAKKAIDRALPRLPNDADRTEVRRCASGASLVADANDMARCVRDLRRRLRRGPAR